MNLETLDDLLLNLKILAKVGQNEKICTQSDEMTVEPNTFKLSVKRFALGETGKNNVNYIAGILTDIGEIIRKMTKNDGDNTHILERIKNHLLNARTGLENLEYTYKNHIKNTDSRIQGQIEKVNDYVMEIETFFQTRQFKKDL